MISGMQVPVSEAELLFEGWPVEWYISILLEAPHTTPSNSTASRGHQIFHRQMAEDALAVEGGALLLGGLGFVGAVAMDVGPWGKGGGGPDLDILAKLGGFRATTF